MAYYRHFFERDDFECMVLTNEEKFANERLQYIPQRFSPSLITKRLFRTRFMPWLYGIHSLLSWGRVSFTVWKKSRDFRPDIVFTIAGSWDWSALIAQRIARRLGVPLVASFNDWYNFGWFPSHPIFHGIIESRFRRFYREADLALCTSDGMREALGPHFNAHILYPIGAPLPETMPTFQPYRNLEKKYVVGFGGSLGEWYGPMVERLVRESETQHSNIEFRIYGGNPSWSHDFDQHARASGIYRGLVPFAELQAAMHQVDAMILPMGFGPECALIEKTSFKTKFLDYLTYQKPIVVWGPEYCSAVRVAKEFDSAEICSDPDSQSALTKIVSLCNSPDRQMALVQNAGKMYGARFNPEKIHADFVSKIYQLVRNT
jgi:glycosyltransferase involved in cell wall biosynthesis